MTPLNPATITCPASAPNTPCNLSGVYPPARTSEPIKNSTVSSGKIRSKINSVGVGHPRNSRNNAIVKSITRPARAPAQNPQISVLAQHLTDESEEGMGMSGDFWKFL